MKTTNELPRHYTKTWTAPNGAVLTAYIAPCSWMYNGYGLQVEVGLQPDGGGIHLHHPQKRMFESYSVTDFDGLVAGVEQYLALCVKCSKRLAWTHESSNRESKCEQCFMEELNEVFRKEQAKEEARAKRRDAKRKAQGYTHKAVAWVHPARGGDDYTIEIYFNYKPTDADVKAHLKKEGSRRLDDFRIEAI